MLPKDMSDNMREFLSVSGWWWAALGRLRYAWHRVRRQETRWRVSIDLPQCPGDLTCDTCSLLF